MTTTTTLPWNQLLLDQLEHHWVGQLRPRLDGLTDDEYLWEPVPGAWNVHVDGDRTHHRLRRTPSRSRRR